MNGKTIRFYLVNGSPTDILTAEIINWTGKIIVAPPSQLNGRKMWKIKSEETYQQWHEKQIAFASPEE